MFGTLRPHSIGLCPLMYVFGCVCIEGSVCLWMGEYTVVCSVKYYTVLGAVDKNRKVLQMCSPVTIYIISIASLLLSNLR